MLLVLECYLYLSMVLLIQWFEYLEPLNTNMLRIVIR
jgi:hypothetical protein